MASSLYSTARCVPSVAAGVRLHAIAGLHCWGAGLLRRPFAVLAHTWRGEPAEGSSGPGRVAVLLHGILGSKSNWNTPAQRLWKQVAPQGWRVLQLDLRAHGQSPVGEPPHTLEACAADVVETLKVLGVKVGEDKLVMCGHSFGGKVALTFTHAQLKAGLQPPCMTWLFDSIPGCPVEHSAEQQRREQSVSFVLSAVERAATRGPFIDRAALVDMLVKEQGCVEPLAKWVAQSVRSAPGGGVELAYDIGTIRALYDAYRTTDMWEVLEGGQADIGVVVAGRNRQAWGETNLLRLESCQKRVRVVTLEHAGHNVHVDDLTGLLKSLEPTFM